MPDTLSSASGEYAIGVDLGGTNLRAAAISHSGQILDRIESRTAFSHGHESIETDRENLLTEMAGAISQLRTRSGAAKLAGIGVGVPGFISMKEGVVRNSNNLPSLENFPFRDELSRRVGAPVVLENDANAAALGEKWMGAGRDVNDLVLITLGTGVGGGIISDGKILRGAVGMAGEIGHVTVVPNGNPCGCGNRGCIEKHASATAVSATAFLLGLGNLTSKEVYDLAIGGNEKARVVFTAMGEALGILLATLVNVFNFPLYLLGGGVLGAWDLFAPPMLEEARRRSFTFRSTETRVTKAGLGNESGLYGAAYLPWQS